MKCFVADGRHSSAAIVAVWNRRLGEESYLRVLPGPQHPRDGRHGLYGEDPCGEAPALVLRAAFNLHPGEAQAWPWG